MKSNYNPSSEQKLFMQKFCSIAMPGYDKRKGYINVRKKTEKLNIDKRTFYNWKNCESMPSLSKAVKILEERGYRLEITPRYDIIDGKSD